MTNIKNEPRNTAHVMLINNKERVPLVYLIQEKNKRWGIFGGGQEKFDRYSLEKTAARELYEETAGSLYANPQLFRYLDSYSIVDPNGGEHKTFIVINSDIGSSSIKLDKPGIIYPKGLHLVPNRDIIQGRFLPLYLILSCVYKRQYAFMYRNKIYTLRYFFAEAIRRNRDFLYTIFDRKYLTLTESRNNNLGICPVIINQKWLKAQSIQNG